MWEITKWRQICFSFSPTCEDLSLNTYTRYWRISHKERKANTYRRIWWTLWTTSAETGENKSLTMSDFIITNHNISNIIFIYHNHSNHLLVLRIIFVYQLSIPLLWSSSPSSILSIRSLISSLALFPDSIAPSIKPCDTMAISVPAQWILPSRFRMLLIWDKMPGG